MDNEARVIVSLQDGKLEIAGSEQFVRDQLKIFMPLIEKKFTTILIEPIPASTGDQQLAGGVKSKKPELTSKNNHFLNVIAFDGDIIKILKPPSAKTKADKMVNLSLLYLLAASMKNIDVVSYNELRNVCKEHACLDGPNFSAAIKHAESYFILSGKGKKTVKLTHPGKIAAEDLAKELNK
jgi:hypothetical protein